IGHYSRRNATRTSARRSAGGRRKKMKFKVGDKVRNKETGLTGRIFRIEYKYGMNKIYIAIEPFGLYIVQGNDDILERVDNMVEVVRKPVYKQAKVAKAIDEYINKGLHKGNIVEVIDSIYNSNDEGEITEISIDDIEISKAERKVNPIQIKVGNNWTGIEIEEAKQLFTAGLEMCEGE
ncbi:MAG: hypothetical protein ACM3KR_00555, partial [Deltaproteobacteria bacterium]